MQPEWEHIAMQPKLFKRTQSIAGTVLAGVGLFIFCGNVDRAATQMSRLVGTVPRQALGVLPATIMAASRFVQAYASNHQRFLEISLLHALASSWPLLLVAAGAVMSRDFFTD